MEKPIQSPARYIRNASLVELRKMQKAMSNLSEPMGPTKVAKFFKNIKPADREQFAKSQLNSKVLLPIVNDELKKRSKSKTLLKAKND